jgi:hypothetical protein
VIKDDGLDIEAYASHYRRIQSSDAPATATETMSDSQPWYQNRTTHFGNVPSTICNGLRASGMMIQSRIVVETQNPAAAAWANTPCYITQTTSYSYSRLQSSTTRSGNVPGSSINAVGDAESEFWFSATRKEVDPFLQLQPTNQHWTVTQGSNKVPLDTAKSLVRLAMRRASRIMIQGRIVRKCRIQRLQLGRRTV